MKKNGKLWQRNKGSFGGSIAGKKKMSEGRYRSLRLTATPTCKGTVGSKLSRRLS